MTKMHGVLVCLMVVSALSVFFAFARPAEARGELIKGSQSAVYYLAEDGKRYVFPNERIYFSWYPDFSQVTTIADEELATYMLGGNVSYRPGTRLVKLASDPRVYALGPGGVMRWIPAEYVAQTLYGDAWADRVDDIPDAFFGAYRIGASLDGTTYPDGTLLRDRATGTHFLVWNGQARVMTATGFTNNGWNLADAIEAELDAFDRGEDITDEETIYSDTAQLSHSGESLHAVSAVAVPGPQSLTQGGEQLFAAFTLIVEEETVMESPVLTFASVKNGDTDADAGGLVYGDGENQIEANIRSAKIVNAQGELLYGIGAFTTIEDEDDSQTIKLNGTQVWAAGRHQLFVYATVGENVPEDEQYTVTWLLNETTFSVDGNAVDDVDPTSVVGETLTVVGDGIDIEIASGVESFSVTRGQEGAVSPLALTFTNPLPHAVTISEMTLTGYIDENEGDADFVAGSDDDNGAPTSVKDVVSSISAIGVSEGILLAATSVIGLDGRVLLDDLNYVIPASGEVTIEFQVQLDPTAPFELGSDRIAFDLVSNDDIQFTDGIELLTESPNGETDPDIILTVAESGTLTIEGEGSPSAMVVMGSEDNYMYTLTFSADEAEEIIIDTLTMRLLDPTAVDSVGSVELRYDSNGAEQTATAFIVTSSATFTNLNLVVPQNESGSVDVDATVYVNINTSSQGASSGDEVGFAFEPTTLRAHGVQSGFVFTHEEIGDQIVDQTELGEEAFVRKNALVFSSGSEQVATVSAPDTETESFRFSVFAIGEGNSELDTVTFKIVPSDVGTSGTDSDVLERWADLSGDITDDDKIGNVVDMHGDTVGEGSDGDVDFLVYDATTRTRDTTPSDLTTESGDYGILVYRFVPPLTITSETQTFTLELDTTLLAAGTQTVKVTLLGGEDLVWGDGTPSGQEESGDGISGAPLTGPTVTIE